MQLRRPVCALGVTSALVAPLLLLAATPATAVAPAGSTVFLSEVHYDDADTDAGELVEVANPAGADLAGWSVVAYNGNGGAPYDTRPLSGTARFTTVAYPVNGLQNGAPDGLALVRPSGTVEQFLSYEGVVTATSGPASGLTSTDIGVAETGGDLDGQSLQLVGPGATYGDGTWQEPRPATPGAANVVAEEPEPGAVTAISAVQGAGATSPLVGQQVTVEGVVVGDYQGAGQLGGFFVQSTTPDDDPLTSEGLRVLVNGTAVAVGDLVRVTGAVAESASSSTLYTGSETQLGSGSTVEVTGTAPVPAPTPVDLPFAPTVDGVDGQERFEGQLVTLVGDDLVATDLFTLGRFGELSLTTGELLRIPTTAAQDAANNADRITVDDGLSGQNLPVLPFTIGGDGVTLPRAGDGPSEPVTGVFAFANGEYKVEVAPGTTVDFARLAPREPAPQDVGGDLQVASFNVLNYFTSFGGDNRGADDAAELQRQQAKLVAAITGLDADVVGLIEIANDDGAALDTLVAALNAAQPDPADDYTAVEAPALNAPTSLGGTYGTDAIRTAIVYRDAVVDLGAVPSDPAVLNPADPAFPAQPVFDRPPAVATFASGERDVTVVVNHFKSKGSTNAQCGPPDPFGGNCDDLRERQSAALVGLVDDLGATDALLLGDFNSYEDEAPVQVLEDAGYVSAVADLPVQDRSSYSFDGEFGSLDYAFLSPSLASAKTGADIWQVNSPEAVAYDYNSVNQPQLYAPDAYASSDHDPVLVGLATAAAPTGPFTMTLLQSNDGESQLLPAAPRGGVARFGTILKRLQAEAAAEGSPTLLISGGDNYLAGPQLQASLEGFSDDGDYSDDGPFYDALALDHLGYDASSVGNHEFDFGPEVFGYFLSQFTESDIRFVAANLDVSGEEALAAFAQPSPGTRGGALVEWTRRDVGGRSVAVVGVTTPELASVSSPGPDVVADPAVAQAAQEAIDAATADGTDVVVLVSQIQSINNDRALVGQLRGVDIAVSGGGSELLANPDDVLLPGTTPVFGPYPVLATDADGGAQVPVVTTPGLYGYVGRLIVDIDAEGVVTAVDDRSGPVRNVFNATTPPADQATPDPYLLENVEQPVAAFVGDLDAQVVARTEPQLVGTTALVRTRETNLGSLFADALVRTAEQDPAFGASRPVVGLQNSGGIRNSVVLGPDADVSRFDTFQIAPFSNFVGYTTDLAPERLKELLERSVSAPVVGGALQAEGRFGQWSGLRFVYDPAQPAQTVRREADGSVTVLTPGSRVRQVFLTLGTADTADDVPVVRNGVVLRDAPSVDLAANSFTVGQNGDDYPFNLPDDRFVNLPVSYQQSLEAYFRELGTVTRAAYPEGGLGRIAVGGDVPGPTLERIDGTGVVPAVPADRYGTAADLALEAFEAADTAVLVRGDGFADAFSASSLAGALDAPVLLVAPGATTLPVATRQALQQLGVTRLAIVGGTDAVPAALEALLSVEYDVERVSGLDRYATAAAAAVTAGELTDGRVGEVDGLRTAFLGSGESAADLLAASGPSWAADLPLLLTRPGALPAETVDALEQLGVEQVVVLGGTGAVSAPVVTELEQRLDVAVRRLDGSAAAADAPRDRYATAVDVAAFAVEELGFDATRVDLVRGDVPADGLALGAHSGAERTPVLLTRPTDLPAATAAALRAACGGLAYGHVVGGTAAVSEAVRAAAVAAGTCPA